MSLHFIRLSIAIAALLAIAPAGARAAEHVVKMLNDNGKGEYLDSCKVKIQRSMNMKQV